MSPIPPDHRLDASGTASPNQLLTGMVRRASDGMLALAAGVGLVTAAALVVAVPDRWPFALPALAAAAFGGWGILDRVAHELHTAGRVSPVVDGMLDGGRAFLMLAGWGCVLAFFGMVLWQPLGGVIH